MGKIVSFKDLDVYQRAYEASVIVMTEIVPNLPIREKNDLGDHLSYSCKAIPRLKAGFQKYLDDAMGESNEMIVCLEHCRDIYPKFVSVKCCEQLIGIYNIIGRQLYSLSEAWDRFEVKEKVTH